MEYIIKVYKKDPKDSTVIQTIPVPDLDEAFKWMEHNKNKLYTLNKITCVLDMS